MELDGVDVARVDEKRTGNALWRGVDVGVRQKKAHRSLFAWIEGDAGIDGAVLREVGDGVVGGFGVGSAAGDVHGEAHLAVAGKVLDIDGEPLAAGEVQRATAFGRVEAQAAGPLGAGHAEGDGDLAIAPDFRAVDGLERNGAEGESRLDRRRGRFRFRNGGRGFLDRFLMGQLIFNFGNRRRHGGIVSESAVERPSQPSQGDEDENDKTDFHGVHVTTFAEPVQFRNRNASAENSPTPNSFITFNCFPVDYIIYC